MFVHKFTLLLLIGCTAALLASSESKAVFGIGQRIIGDQLLVKDVLDSPPAGLDEQPAIRFHYAIPEPITYIEILSKENVLADVNFSYHNDIVRGTVTTMNAFEAIATSTITSTLTNNANSAGVELLPQLAERITTSSAPLEIIIAIYGFKETMLNVNPAYILNRDQEFNGILEPLQNDEQLGTGEESDYDYEVDEETATPAADAVEWSSDEELAVDENELGNADKMIELGRRQAGDYLIYETSQVSPTHTEEPANHSIVFYYVDSNLITYIRFIIVDHFVGGKAAGHQNYTPPRGDYTHYSPTTLKAIITDYDTTSLFVRMLLYGYRPNDLPSGYQPYLVMSPVQRIKMMLNADKQQRTHGPLVWHPVTEASLPHIGGATAPAAAHVVDGAHIATTCMETASGNAHSGALMVRSTQLALPMQGWTHTAIKTWWMIGLSLLRLFTAQPRV